MTPKQDHKKILSAHALKATRARLAILDLMNQEKKPLGSGEIYQSVRRIADQATVYRVLKSFLEEGILREVNLRHDHVDYELADLPDHHHLVCVRCGLVEDFAECNADKLAKSILKKSKSFRSIQEHTMEFFGLCRTCAAS
jgi:Fur family ferric uptake transcriptional regulator